MARSRGFILQAIHDERERQDQKWGEQNHPDFDLKHFARIAKAEVCRERCDTAAMSSHCSWDLILLEEVAEAVDAAHAGEVRDLREELLQVAAVAVSWIEAIDRRVE